MQLSIIPPWLCLPTGNTCADLINCRIETVGRAGDKSVRFFTTLCFSPNFARGAGPRAKLGRSRLATQSTTGGHRAGCPKNAKRRQKLQRRQCLLRNNGSPTGSHGHNRKLIFRKYYVFLEIQISFTHTRNYQLSKPVFSTLAEVKKASCAPPFFCFSVIPKLHLAILSFPFTPGLCLSKH